MEDHGQSREPALRGHINGNYFTQFAIRLGRPRVEPRMDQVRFSFSSRVD